MLKFIKIRFEGDKLYRHEKTYQLRYTDVDFNDRLKLSSLLSLMEESACLSADELGFGYNVLKPKNYGFILVNWYISLDRTIKFGENLTIHTWPIKPKRLAVFRDFEFYVDGVKVGVATSRWCLVDLDDFSLVTSDAVFGTDRTYNDFRSVEFNSWKIDEIGGGISPDYSKTVSYSDYDHYNHVNNTKYGDILLDAFSVDELAGRYFRAVQIKYVKQCKYGEVLDVVKRRDEEGFWLVEGRVDGELRIQMRLSFDD